mmetsp:Transcript_7929/g.7082  ORF Transcript_7929/g.7082 Transcript_7929/m.7082 type:complete len:210 (-) Transcript_7929:68-697(-)
MVKVVIIGVTGNSGSTLKTELLSRGHEVIGVTRDAKKVQPEERLTVVQADALNDDLVPIIQGADVVVNAYAPGWDDVTVLIKETTKLIDAVKSTGVNRLIHVGGAGTLNIEGSGRVIDQPWFPENWKGIAQAHVDAFEILKNSSINWTVLTPPTYFEVGERTGKFRLGEDNLIFGPDGKAAISYADYAIALADEIETPKNIKKRFTVAY